MTNSSDIYSGGEYFVLILSKYLKEKGYDVTVCCRSDNLLYEKAKEENIKLFDIDFPRKGKEFTYGKIIYNFVKNNKIDIVHTNTNYDRTVGAFAAKLAGAKHVANVHSFQSISHNITHFIRNKFFTDRILSDGESIKQLLVQKDSINSEKIKVIHLGIDPESMKRDYALRDKVREEFKIDNKTILFGTTGRYVEFKGHEYLIKAFGEVCNIFDDTKLMLVGYGELEDRLKKLTNDYGITEKVIFTGFRNDLQAVYSAFDVYVHSSIEGGGEAFPFSVLYSLAQGIPAIVTDVGDVSVMVENGATGFSVEDKKTKALTEKMLYFLSNRDDMKLFGERALDMLNKKFSIIVMSEDIIKVYYELLNR